jgi:phosphatidylserine/phosphatidylglycerophosphate/cardiolipin synthase-like enzyme
VLLRPHRDPASGIAWILLIAGAPILGMLAYVFMGETSVGPRRAARLREIERSLPPYTECGKNVRAAIPERHAQIFDVGKSISSLGPVAGQNQRLFVTDWMESTDEDIRDVLREPVAPPEPGVPAQAFGTGPTVRLSAMPEMFDSLLSKSFTVDGGMTLIGSANLDRRSFELNYENNILFCDAKLTADLEARQRSYIASSKAVTPEEVASWPVWRRLWNNAIAMLGPVL